MKSFLKRVINSLICIIFLLSVVMCACDCGKQKEDFAWNNDDELSTFIDGLGGFLDDYSGCLSDGQYVSGEIAAKYYVTEQLFNGENNCDFLDVECETLKEKQIEKLDFFEAFLKNADAVYRYNVKYALKMVARNNLEDNSSGGETQLSVIVYVAKFGQYFKYLVPALKQGEQLNTAYYNYVFNNNHFNNCTYNQTISYCLKINSIDQTGLVNNSELNFKYNILVKICNENIIYTLSIESDNQLVKPLYVSAFIKKNEQGFDFSLIGGEVADFEQFKQLIEDERDLNPLYGFNLEPSCFIKTHFGFRLPKEYLYKCSAIEYVGKEEYGDAVITNGYADYVVDGNSIKAIRAKVNTIFNVNDSNVEQEVLNTIKCYDIGCTTVNDYNK